MIFVRILRAGCTQICRFCKLLGSWSPLFQSGCNLKNFSRIVVFIAQVLALYGASLPVWADGRGGSGRSAPWVGQTFWGEECQGSRIPFGPFDYTERAKYQGELFITEEYHFTKRIANLQQDSTTSAIKDIQYTLMAWPNHHGALYSAFQYRKQARGQWAQSANSATPVECHLMRAINFAPKDPVPYMIQGMLLHDFQHYTEALESFRKANALMPNDVITQYNMGLTMVVLEMYEEAVKVAEQVYSTDFPLPGLKNQLSAAGYWPPGQKPDPQGQAKEAVENELPEGEMESIPPSGVEESVSAIDGGVDTTVIRQ